MSFAFTIIPPFNRVSNIFSALLLLFFFLYTFHSKRDRWNTREKREQASPFANLATPNLPTNPSVTKS